MAGKALGNYEIVDKLGEGILPPDVAGDPLRRERFEREARALGALNHPNIVTVHDIGQDDGRAYIVSELVDGESPIEAHGIGGDDDPPGWRSDSRSIYARPSGESSTTIPVSIVDSRLAGRPGWP